VWFEWGAVLGLSGLSAWAIVQAFQGASQLQANLEQADRTAALRRQLYWWVQANARLAEWQEATQSSIDGGTRAAYALHKGIAAIPFEILAAIPATRDTSRVMRGVHDFATDNIYAAIAAVNRMAGERSRKHLNITPTAKIALERAESRPCAPAILPPLDQNKS
jgi:hypothetical protein